MNYDLIDLSSWSKEEWEEILSLAIDIYNNSDKYNDICKGKILATLFFEPSTRTQMSFQSAMLRLGGQVIGFDNEANSSVSKGESLSDTIKVVSYYANMIVMRHPKEGSALLAAINSKVPLINAGDGGHLHPTQTLTDLLTLKITIGNIKSITIGLCGDLKHGRTVHSLIKALALYDNIKFILISTKDLRLPDIFKDYIFKQGSSFVEMFSLEEAISELDVLYMTRIQKERFFNDDAYKMQSSVYILDKDKLSLAKKSLKILHPLPRVDEISPEVDNDNRAIYFKQAELGVFARMALIITLLEKKKEYSKVLIGNNKTLICRNGACISNCDNSVINSMLEFEGDYYCEYCETKF